MLEKVKILLGRGKPDIFRKEVLRNEIKSLRQQKEKIREVLTKAFKRPIFQVNITIIQYRSLLPKNLEIFKGGFAQNPDPSCACGGLFGGLFEKVNFSYNISVKCAIL